MWSGTLAGRAPSGFLPLERRRRKSHASLLLRARAYAKEGNFASVVLGLLLAGCVGRDFDKLGG